MFCFDSIRKHLLCTASLEYSSYCHSKARTLLSTTDCLLPSPTQQHGPYGGGGGAASQTTDLMRAYISHNTLQSYVWLSNLKSIAQINSASPVLTGDRHMVYLLTIVYGECSKPSNLCHAVPHNKHYTLLLENISLYFVLRKVIASSHVLFHC